MNQLRASWTIARKDLRIYFRDRTGMLLGFGLPVVLVLAFGFTFKMSFGGPDGLTRSTLWVADLDQSERSQAFVGRLRSADTIRVRPRDGEENKSEAELRELVEDGEAHHALVIEAGFGQALEAQRFPELTLFRDPGRELEAQMVSIGLMQAFLGSKAMNLAPLVTTRALQLSGLPESFTDRIRTVSNTFSDSVGALFMEASQSGLLEEEEPADEPGEGATDGPADQAGAGFAAIISQLIPVDRIDIQPPERPKQLSYMLAHVISGISVMMLMFGLVACGVLMIQEREEGTLQRLLMTAVPRNSLLWGKFLFTAVIGICQLLVMFGVGGLVFQVNLVRDPITLLVLSMALVFAVTSFGMLIAALSRTSKQAEGMSTLIILVMSAVGGAWFPVQMFDLPLAGVIATRCTVTWWAMSAYQGMLWYGKSWTDPGMLRDVAVLLGFGLVASMIAIRTFRRRYIES